MITQGSLSMKVAKRNKKVLQNVTRGLLEVGQVINVDVLSYKNVAPTSTLKVEAVCDHCGVKNVNVKLQYIREDGGWCCGTCAVNSENNQERARWNKDKGYVASLEELAEKLNASLTLKPEGNRQFSTLTGVCSYCREPVTKKVVNVKKILKKKDASKVFECATCINREILSRPGVLEKKSLAIKGKKANLTPEGRARKAEAQKRRWQRYREDDDYREQYLKKIRTSTLEYLAECKPKRRRYNNESINYLQTLAERMDSQDYHHALTKEGEFITGGFSLDLYLKDKNVWVEWDEAGHRYGKKAQQDLKRESIISKEMPVNTLLVRIDHDEAMKRSPETFAEELLCFMESKKECPSYIRKYQEH